MKKFPALQKELSSEFWASEPKDCGLFVIDFSDLAVDLMVVVGSGSLVLVGFCDVKSSSISSSNSSTVSRQSFTFLM